MLFLFLISAFGGVSILYVLIRPIVNGAIYFTTKADACDAMIRLSSAKQGEKIADLGSGDGRVVIAFAKLGCETHGYEINPFLVWISRRAILRAELKDKAFVHWKSFWKIDFSSFDVIALYGIPRIMDKLETKRNTELKPGTRIVSNSYSFPKWKLEKKENHVRLYRYGQLKDSLR